MPVSSPSTFALANPLSETASPTIFSGLSSIISLWEMPSHPSYLKSLHVVTFYGITVLFSLEHHHINEIIVFLCTWGNWMSGPSRMYTLGEQWPVRVSPISFYHAKMPLAATNSQRAGTQLSVRGGRGTRRLRSAQAPPLPRHAHSSPG